jgi:hypothetical protein
VKLFCFWSRMKMQRERNPRDRFSTLHVHWSPNSISGKIPATAWHTESWWHFSRLRNILLPNRYGRTSFQQGLMQNWICDESTVFVWHKLVNTSRRFTQGIRTITAKSGMHVAALLLLLAQRLKFDNKWLKGILQNFCPQEKKANYLTQVFQALRIEWTRKWRREDFLQDTPKVLEGRLVVITTRWKIDWLELLPQWQVPGWCR